MQRHPCSAACAGSTHRWVTQVCDCRWAQPSHKVSQFSYYQPRGTRLINARLPSQSQGLLCIRCAERGKAGLCGDAGKPDGGRALEWAGGAGRCTVHRLHPPPPTPLPPPACFAANIACTCRSACGPAWKCCSSGGGRRTSGARARRCRRRGGAGAGGQPGHQQMPTCNDEQCAGAFKECAGANRRQLHQLGHSAGWRRAVHSNCCSARSKRCLVTFQRGGC